jgi:hypothetical protein
MAGLRQPGVVARLAPGRGVDPLPGEQARRTRFAPDEPRAGRRGRGMVAGSCAIHAATWLDGATAARLVAFSLQELCAMRDMEERIAGLAWIERFRVWASLQVSNGWRPCITGW